MRWNNDVNMRCPFCNNCPDSHDHLLFQCQYSKNVWTEFESMKALKQLPSSWKDTILALVNWFPNKSIVSIVGKLVFGAMVYYIWQERNKRLFSQEKRNEKTLTEIIKILLD